LGYSNVVFNKCLILPVQGLRGFYKGVSASYWGLSDTVIHFVIYERVKEFLVPSDPSGGEKGLSVFFKYMAAASMSKTISASLTYPHEVARTRLREENSRYNGFWQTIFAIYHEEGPLALYRGFLAQMLRQIPSTAITMFTYEAVVYLIHRLGRDDSNERA
ncbi:unnamed protein product, partial [Cyprideis torosa]